MCVLVPLPTYYANDSKVTTDLSKVYTEQNQGTMFIFAVALSLVVLSQGLLPVMQRKTLKLNGFGLLVAGCTVNSQGDFLIGNCD